MMHTISASTPLVFFALFCLTTLSGCLSPVTLTRAVIAYDDAITESQSKQLLANIARAQHHQPIHFTGVSNIAATFDFRFTAGATPALTGDASRTILPVIGGSVAENPTISIAPIEGDEFTQRLLTPFQESKLTLLLRQGVDIDLLLRLMGKELRLKQRDGAVAYRNNPSDQVGYEMFRRVVLHLSAIQDHNSLYVEPMSIERSWTIPADSITAEGFKALEQDYQVAYNGKDKTFTLRKQVEGGALITNYDPNLLSREERARLQKENEQGLPHDVTFDIRPGYFGGEWPLDGHFRLRSFNAMLNFLALSLDEEPEYHVDKDGRTPDVGENPVKTMDVVVSSSLPSGLDLAMKSHGHYYAVNTIGSQARWNREAFKLLSQLFQMTVTEVPRAGVPSITIAK
ncbi:MAG: hypothetical protein OEV99_16795 [Nitrospira sp.]|nr:hypothetical protein [Nitrospira sp.]MDH4371481.1 hypothetical protein [Nitrospira sp.]MDH5349027.1 hypothetical protein [Nitrospira sp.]MDH5499093.1 hypothetical protein [Nitrospira sp.]MDH5727007.1 hypothetical protein [Nitrospira sp.]